MLTAVRNIDEVVKIIRESRDKKSAATALQERFELTIIQSNAILEMRLHQLTGLAIEDLEKEFEELIKHIEYLKSLLASRQLRLDIVKEELIEVRTKYATPRRTEIIHSTDDYSIADLIERHACVINVSNTGYIQRVNTDTFKTQHRGGKGVKGMDTKDDDYIEHLFVADSHDLIFFFSDKGTMYWLNVYEIPEGSRTGKGKAIINLIKVDPGEQIKAMLTVKEADVERDDLYITMATQNGYIKKTCLSAYKNLRKGGIRSINIEEDDDLIDVALTDGSYEILMSSKLGLACRFKEADVRPMGRTARGVTGIKFKLEGDSLISMLAVKSAPESKNNDEDILDDNITEDIPDVDIEEEAVSVIDETEPDNSPQILVVSDAGMGKRSYVNKYRMTRRAAKGVVSIRLNKGEKVISAIQVEKADEILITTKNGQTVRIPTDEIRTIGRASKGVRIMNLKGKNDIIASVAKLMEIKFDDEDNAEQIESEEETSESPVTEESSIESTDDETNSTEVDTDTEPEKTNPEK